MPFHVLTGCFQSERASVCLTSSHFQVHFGVGLFLFYVIISFCAFYCLLLFLYLSSFVFILLPLVFLTNNVPNKPGWSLPAHPDLSWFVCVFHPCSVWSFSPHSFMLSCIFITDAFHQPITVLWGFYFVLPRVKTNFFFLILQHFPRLQCFSFHLERHLSLSKRASRCSSV